MNRIVLIGNGFDLAHGLKTSYADFIYWYWKRRVTGLYDVRSTTSDDILCTLEIVGETWYIYYSQHSMSLNNSDGKTLYQFLNKYKDKFVIRPTTFFNNIHKSIETKGWVDIENEYYELLKKYALDEHSVNKVNELNSQLHFLQDKLVEYLREMDIREEQVKQVIRQKIYEPLKPSDISVAGGDTLIEHVKEGLKLDDRTWDWKLQPYGRCYTHGYVDSYRKKHSEDEKIDWEYVPKELLLPNHIMLLDFNYTRTAQSYCKESSSFTINHIHGNVEQPESVIFGYGDELDEDYKKISNKNENNLLTNIKSIKYLEAENYRQMLSFIEMEPYQILIMGHSCGNSDRTLLNTLFEHKNCVSIKPYFYKKDGETDNYLELIQNISRNFTDMKLMRDRVVNKTYCEPLT